MLTPKENALEVRAPANKRFRWFQDLGMQYTPPLICKLSYNSNVTDFLEKIFGINANISFTLS